MLIRSAAGSCWIAWTDALTAIPAIAISSGTVRRTRAGRSGISPGQVCPHSARRGHLDLRANILRAAPFCNTFPADWFRGEKMGGDQRNDHNDYGGLHRDLLATGAAMDRRDLFRLAARLGVSVGALPLIGCSGSSTAPTATTTTTTTTTSSSCTTRVPEETQGPYPGDGSN